MDQPRATRLGPRHHRRPRPRSPGCAVPGRGRRDATLADKGYTGTGIGIHVPTKGRHLGKDNQSRNLLLNASRASAERANALLKSTWKALRRVTVCRHRIGTIVAAALVLLTMQRSRW